MRYFVKLDNNNEIDYFGMGIDVPTCCTEIEKEKYDMLMDTLTSIPSKEGYLRIVHLRLDGTYTVDYEEIIELEEE